MIVIHHLIHLLFLKKTSRAKVKIEQMDTYYPIDCEPNPSVDPTFVTSTKVSDTPSTLSKDLPQHITSMSQAHKIPHIPLPRKNPHYIHPLMKHTFEHLIDEFLSSGNVSIVGLCTTK